MSEVLEKYEDEFCRVVNAKCMLLKLIRKGVITQDLERHITTSSDADGREILYDHLKHHGSVDTLREYCKVAMTADSYPLMQKLAEKIMHELSLGGWFQSSPYQSHVCTMSMYLCMCLCT